jgi:hypothetical protein
MKPYCLFLFYILTVLAPALCMARAVLTLTGAMQ